MLAFLLLVLTSSSSAGAQARSASLELASLFKDHMVLQRGVEVPVFGTAAPAVEVTAMCGEHTRVTYADAQGRWMVKLGPYDAGGPFELRVISGSNEFLEVHDVLVGEVWLCSGQSNMEWPVSGTMNAREEIAAATLPRIRMFTCSKNVAEAPQSNVGGEWKVCSPESAGGFSAVGYYFGRELHRSLNVPIGLIHSSWGGTPAESWSTLATLRGHPDLAPIVARYEQQVASYPTALEAHRQQLEQWQRDAEAARQQHATEPQRPNPPPDPARSSWRPAGLFHAMIAPLVPFAIRGAIWYQGESNADRAEQYHTLFPAMIADWRRAWGQGDFPFLFVQLANFQAEQDEPRESAWAELREAQRRTLAVAKTGMAVAIDIGDARDIHPRNKQEVGRRLALLARAQAYDEAIECSGPALESSSIEHGEVVLRFAHTGGGLVASDGHALGFRGRWSRPSFRLGGRRDRRRHPPVRASAWRSRWRCATAGRQPALQPGGRTAPACRHRRFAPTTGRVSRQAR
ncbi:MAG: sialate O-acetylesterase [Planctomycetota bacterium]